MGHVILGWDGTDAEAPARRAAVRDRHLSVITRWVEEGRLNLAVPLFEPDGRALGSVMILGDADEVEARQYLLEEPFAREGVWLSYQMRPFRIAPLPYQPLPNGPMPSSFTHVVSIVEDQPGGTERRAHARGPHLERVRQFAADGTLALGGALLDAKGQMVGSITVTRHPTVEEADAFWAEDPYVTEGVWGEARRFPTRFAPLPYKALPTA
ncbi:YciI family protein [Sabulicella rubraurantiaca]|uniref:YciI family protein n=1 Tax=Sabulicella rubraurantiaca TaxID=2811429 RepID=UPI001A968B3C|nr:YciI family protein [Sabulicella rubraurantiaca]